MPPTDCISLAQLTRPPLPGIDHPDQVWLRPLAKESILSAGNKLLRFEFPISRWESVVIPALQKGITQAPWHKDQLQTLPLSTLAQVFNALLELSAQHILATEDHSTHPARDSVLNTWLSLILAVEDGLQFELPTLVSEDMAQIEQRRTASLALPYYRLTDDGDALHHMLTEEGFQSYFPNSTLPNTFLTYWISRQLSYCPPWVTLFQLLDDDSRQRYRYLHRFEGIAQWLENALPEDAWSNPAKRFINQDLAHNVSWIISHEQTEGQQYSSKAHIPCPVQCLVLVEGQTELVMLPALAKAMGVDFIEQGIYIAPVGGKNQLVSSYVAYAETLSIPICVIMDADAKPIYDDCRYYQRPNDTLILLEQGELEELYPKLWMEAALSDMGLQQDAFGPLSEPRQPGGTVRWLHHGWSVLGLGSFDKVTFARQLIQTIQSQPDLVETERQRPEGSGMITLIEQIMDTKRAGAL